MTAIDWQQVIAGLVGSGMTQPTIAAACGCAQSTVSAIVTGKTVDPRTSIGLTLMRLARERGVPVPGAEQTMVTTEEAQAHAR